MTSNIHGLGRGGVDGFRSELIRALRNIPIVTRYLIFSVVMVKIATRLFVNPNNFVGYVFNETVKHVQFWRPFTSSMILHPDPMPAIMELYTIYSRSSQLELRRQRLDYAFYMFFCVLVMSVMAPLYYGTENFVILTSGFLMCLTYTWSLDNSNLNVMVYGLFPIRGKYFPLVQLLLDFMFFSNWFPVTVMGFLAAYLYACLDTGTLGPIYGWSTGASEFYGITPNGKLGAPQWLHKLSEASRHPSRTMSARSGGRKLGSKDHETTSSSTITAPVARDTSTTVQRRARRTVFPGSGQRLGN